MKVENTFIEGLYILEPIVYEDNRGFFFETYQEEILKSLNIDTKFVQDNQSRFDLGTLNGLYFQKEPNLQAKLIRVLSGEILYLAMDLRAFSSTYRKYFCIKLSAENKKQLYIPRRFGHAFLVLSDFADLFQKCDNYYSKMHEDKIHFDIKEFKINKALK